MEVLYPHCAGLDVHKETVVACVRRMAAGKISISTRTFKTTTQELMALSDWLAGEGATHIGMEATGVYWKPVWHILSDGEFHLVLANAGVPSDRSSSLGWKTDVNDAAWLADLMAHGLIKASFVPDQPTQQMRDLLRTRKQLVRERASHTQRIQKTLEDANIKLDCVVTDILGLNGRRILEALAAGQTMPQALASLAHRRIHASTDELEAALRGQTPKHAHEKGSPLAEDGLGAMRLGSIAHQGKLFPGPIPSHTGAPRFEESCLRSGCLFASHCLSHAEKWHHLPRPRPRPLRPARQAKARPAPDPTSPKPRLRCPDKAQAA